MAPAMNLKNGDVSAYALACGYIDVKTRTTESGKDVEIRLSNNGSSYDVDAVIPGEPREFINGIMSGWAQFDTLTEARKFQRHLAKSPNIRTVSDMFTYCLTRMV